MIFNDFMIPKLHETTIVIGAKISWGWKPWRRLNPTWRAFLPRQTAN